MIVEKLQADEKVKPLTRLGPRLIDSGMTHMLLSCLFPSSASSSSLSSVSHAAIAIGKSHPLLWKMDTGALLLSSLTVIGEHSERIL